MEMIWLIWHPIRFSDQIYSISQYSEGQQLNLTYFMSLHFLEDYKSEPLKCTSNLVVKLLSST